MTTKKPPRILILDDNEDELRTLKLTLESKFKAEVKVRLPGDIETDDLSFADLVLVDYDLTGWIDTLGGLCPSNQPVDGLGLATVLRRHIVNIKKEPPTAFGLISAKVNRISAPFPSENRIHLLSRVNNLEWIFLKQKDDRIKSITSLARAVQSIPSSWASRDESPEKIMSVLGLDELGDSKAACREDIEACHPPVYELTRWSHGLAMVRWLLHQILPYPCFLWDMRRLAARFRVQYASFVEGFEKSKRLRHELERFQYRGLLSDFDGDRWWRQGIEKMIWELTNGNTGSADSIRTAINSLAGYEFTPSECARPIVCIDSNYKPLDDFRDINDAVRIHLDDWPSVHISQTELRVPKTLCPLLPPNTNSPSLIIVFTGSAFRICHE